MLHKLISLMIDHFPDRRYVEHALKVYGYARGIGGEEGLDNEELALLEAAAVIHDIGIPVAIKIHGSGAGPYQEKEGARIAPAMLARAGYDSAQSERIARLIGHHHSPQYTAEDSLLQLLLEADDLVNLSEKNASAEIIAASRASLFKTASGLRYLDKLFSAGQP